MDSTSKLELNQAPPDWFLPLKHEAFYWRQFAGGGRTFIDVGAHVGTWCLNLAPYFERVFAFEPDPRGWEALKTNLALNKITNVEVIPKAVSNVSGNVKLKLFYNPCTNTMMEPTSYGGTDTGLIGIHDVEAVSIDEFVESRGITDVDFIKIDTEAAEMLVVEGAVRTFRSQRPDFFIEMHGLYQDRLRALLDPLHCDVIDGGQRGLNLLSHRDRWPGFASDDFLVYPHGMNPVIEDMRKLRAKYGMTWPTGIGWNP